MRFVLLVASFLIFMFVGTFVFLFTPVGNPIVAGIVESKIKEQTQLNAKFEKFKLSWGYIDTTLKIDQNIITLAGDYSIFAKSFDINYALDMEDLSSFSALAGSDLKGTLKLNGNLQGDMQNTKVTGKSDIASSDTSFDIDLVKFYPTKIIANIKNASLKEILDLAGQGAFASGDVNVDILIKDFNPNSLDGLAKVNVKNGLVDTNLMKKEFEIDLPKTNFELNLDALLQKDISYDLLFNSNLAVISSDGNIIADSMFINSKYDIKVDELGLFTPIINYPLKGALNANGTIKGDQKSLDISLISNLAKSNTNLNLNLKEFAPNSVTGSIKDLNLESLLHMISMPNYASSLIDMNIDIKNAKVGELDGNITTNIKNGVLNPQTIKKEFEIDIPSNNRFRADATTKLDGTKANSSVNLVSTIANVNTKSTVFDINEASLSSDFKVTISDLNNLFFITQTKLIGNMELNGDIYQKGEDLKINVASNTLGGSFKANMINEKLRVDIASLEILEILKMLDYGQFFKGKINGEITYDTLAQAGLVNADFAGGHFTKNNMTSLIAAFTGIDLLKETFSKATLSSKIDKNIITTQLDMSSTVVDIKTKDALIDTEAGQIDALLEMQVAKIPLKVKVKGATASPNISLDGQKAVQEKAKESIKKEIDRAIEKNVGEDAKQLLRGLFR
ncbi:hypothetical protein [Arcobacter sp. FWKO B]|uniref:hypothetical protein n=1 Tax=Arcobacter sp. FWKO B TaxID=2593672 RepID=UPI0018A3F787|nr:hypothetical protein [Arcobacter sp. FWKO B]QOG11573.1 hypothetical protein FWKOB_02160 [Arcobacter sp. FWKO B]